MSVKPYSQIPFPQLSNERVQPSPAFSHTGVDYFGPLLIENNFKTRIVLFTCLTVRAIYLKIAENLSFESFINCLRRFVGRKSKPQSIISDNGKQFVLAKKVLDSACQTNPLNS